MKHVKSLLLAVLAVVLAVSYAVPVTPAFADSGSSAISVTPRKNYVINPGETVHDTLSITNMDNSSQLNLSLRTIDFTYDGHGGVMKMNTDPNAAPTTWSVRPFITMDSSTIINAGSTGKVGFDITVPKNQGAGSYYSVILYASGVGSGSGPVVGLSAAVATQVFVTIPGKVKENLQFTHLGAYDSSAQGDFSGYHYFNTKMPENVAFTLKNNGNVVEAPSGSITLRDIFGRTTTINEVNPNQSLALIGQERTFISCIKLKSTDIKIGGTSTNTAVCDGPGLWPGYYKVSADLFYGQNGNLTQEITRVGGFWYLPWWFILVATIVIIALVFYGWRAYNKIRNKFYGPKLKRTPGRRRK